MNKDIISSKIVLLTGAGASKSLDKYLMPEFVDFVKGGGCKELSGKITINKGFFKDLTDFVGNDLEEILTLLTSVRLTEAHLSSTSWSLIYCPRLVGAEIHGTPGSLANSFNEETRHYFSLCDYVYDVLIKNIVIHYGNIDEKKAFETYKPLLDNILPHKKGSDSSILPVFTTNYDSAIEALNDKDNIEVFFARKVYTTRMCIEPELYEAYSPLVGKRNIILFHLHGAAAWIERNEKIEYLSTVVPQGARTDYVHRITFPLKDKMFEDAYSDLAYNYFSRCLDKAILLVIIGYSFRDRNLATRIYSALDFNSELKILVCDPKACELVKEFFPSQADRFICINNEFPANELLEELKRALNKF